MPVKRFTPRNLPEGEYVRREDYVDLELQNAYLLARLRKQGEQLEAIGAGGVSARRITSTPANASSKITERSQAYLDGSLDARGEPVVLATYHAVVSEDYKYIQRDIRTNQLEIYEEREDAVTAALDHFGVIPVYVTSNEGPLYAAPQPADPVVKDSLTTEKHKCDGNHGGPRCADPECWNDTPDEQELTATRGTLM